MIIKNLDKGGTLGICHDVNGVIIDVDNARAVLTIHEAEDFLRDLVLHIYNLRAEARRSHCSLESGSKAYSG